jgi:7-cyano-7-deazaguanine reductase
MEKRSDTSGLSQLGQGATKPSTKLEAFPNSHPQRETTVTLRCKEFTCLCPATGQPDFAELEVSYIPDRKVLESKSLKLYLWTFRDVGVFHEQLVNDVLDDLAAFLEPRWIRVTGRFNARGGISIDVVAERDLRS